MKNAPPLFGALYIPEPVTEPPVAPSWTDQLTAVLLEPTTVAVKDCEPPSGTVAVERTMVIESSGGAERALAPYPANNTGPRIPRIESPLTSILQLFMPTAPRVRSPPRPADAFRRTSWKHY
jgi:hypothetical protein